MTRQMKTTSISQATHQVQRLESFNWSVAYISLCCMRWLGNVHNCRGYVLQAPGVELGTGQVASQFHNHRSWVQRLSFLQAPEAGGRLGEPGLLDLWVCMQLLRLLRDQETSTCDCNLAGKGQSYVGQPHKSCLQSEAGHYM